jgi:predicted HD superfamily hydrolase involved in NAD metabolism
MNQILQEHYISFLKKVLTPSRLQHSLGVMQVMGELTDVYALDREKAITAGLLHDAGKDLPPAQQQQIIQEAGIEIDFPCDHNYLLYLHGPAGAYFVQKELGITDPLIIDAISMHTFYGNGENYDTPFLWCLRFADILEPNRNWSSVRWFRDGQSRLRQVVYAGKLEEGAFLQTGWLIKMFEENSFPVHPNIRRVFRELSK